MNLNGTEYFYVRNAQNDIIGLIDKVGTQVVAYNYDSWGKMTPSKAEIDDASDTSKNGITGTLKDTVGVKNPYRYKGYRYDTETGLYYLQSRYYNPEWGRFINADALIGQTGELLGHNMFAYCKNNPVNRQDKNGFRSSGVIDECGGLDEDIEVVKPRKKDRSGDIAKTIGISVVDTAIGDKIKEKIPEAFPVAINREAARNKLSPYRFMVPNAKSLLLIKRCAAAGIFGLITSTGTIINNYNSYGFWEATGRSSIDVLVSTASIGASIAFSPAGGFAAGVVFGVGGDMIKDAIWSKD